MLATEDRAAAQALEPLRITVPTAGVHFAFEKLYANQSNEESRFSITYASSAGATAGKLFSLIGALLLWVGIGLRVRPVTGVSARAAMTIASAGGIILAVTLEPQGHLRRAPIQSQAQAQCGIHARHHLFRWP